MYLSALHHPLSGDGTLRIPTLISEGPEGQAKPSDWPVSTSAFTNVNLLRLIIALVAMKCIGTRISTNILEM